MIKKASRKAVNPTKAPNISHCQNFIFPSLPSKAYRTVETLSQLCGRPLPFVCYERVVLSIMAIFTPLWSLRTFSISNGLMIYINQPIPLSSTLCVTFQYELAPRLTRANPSPQIL